MNELNISTLIQIMQKGFSEHDKQESASKFLLDSINEQEFVINGGFYTDINSKKVSRRVNRQDPVPDGIKIASQKYEVIGAALKYF